MPRPPSQIFGQLPGVLPRPTLVGGDVVETGTDDTGGNGPQTDRTEVVACAFARSLQPTAREPHRDDHTEGDHQPVGVDRQGAEPEYGIGGAGDAGDELHGSGGDALGESHRRRKDQLLVEVLGGDVVAELEQDALDRPAVTGLEVVRRSRLDDMVLG